MYSIQTFIQKDFVFVLKSFKKLFQRREKFKIIFDHKISLNIDREFNLISIDRHISTVKYENKTLVFDPLDRQTGGQSNGTVRKRWSECFPPVRLEWQRFWSTAHKLVTTDHWLGLNWAAEHFQFNDNLSLQSKPYHRKERPTKPNESLFPTNNLVFDSMISCVYYFKHILYSLHNRFTLLFI